MTGRGRGVAAPRRFLVGLTGGIGSGKSLALRAFRRAGASTLSLDQVARDVVRPGRPAWRSVARRFPGVSGRGGEIDRAALARRVFGRPRLRRLLERLTHPAILGVMRRWASRARGVAVVDVPLLFERGLSGDFDLTVMIAAPRGRRLGRLKARDGMTRAEALRRMSAQAPEAAKARRADVVIPNGRSRADLRRRVVEYFHAFELIAGGTHGQQRDA